MLDSIYYLPYKIIFMQEALHSFLVNEIVYLETEPISNLGSQCVERSLNETEKMST